VILKFEKVLENENLICITGFEEFPFYRGKITPREYSFPTYLYASIDKQGKIIINEAPKEAEPEQVQRCVMQ
jgi:hypothetical protein